MSCTSSYITARPIIMYCISARPTVMYRKEDSVSILMTASLTSYRYNREFAHSRKIYRNEEFSGGWASK